MGRAERRQAERKARLEENRGSVRIRQSDLSKIKRDIREEVSVYSVDMLLTCVALAEHRLYGWDADQCLQTLNYIDELMGDINSDTCSMKDYVEALKDELGLEIRSEGRTIG